MFSQTNSVKPTSLRFRPLLWATLSYFEGYTVSGDLNFDPPASWRLKLSPTAPAESGANALSVANANLRS